ncbi:a59223a7-0601-4de7-930a-b5252c0e5b16 [Sclerotinia trifoliorum]|uniref:A59223a7-0601-4de7-930a-b5252c0e5b16 n=1 Tax=Sclerotinia trifoliorum TaxID=28548 RepID=A0A8H2VQN2_9HELO|nr:a59223a7-0601-4de7-930a-b5252c0e5b16 [Sclerotinia trifoliorum]
MGILVKLVGSGLGLVLETIHHHRNKSSSDLQASSNNGESSRAGAQLDHTYNDAPPQYVEVSPEEANKTITKGQAVPINEKEKYEIEKELEDEDSSDTESEEGDEEAWALDEAANPSNPTTPSEEIAQNADELTNVFIRNHPPPAYSASKPKLPCPVILPQRRPRDKKRGFIRAYAPVLEDCGIDQATFLDFLKTFYHASKSSPWLNVINAAAGIVGFVPGPITMGVSIATQFAVGVAMELQARSRTNTFLDRMNNEFFMPRDLYCLILTYKPESSATHASVDITKAISSSLDDTTTGFKKTLKNIKLSSGTTYGELEMPEAAPLIFPALDQIVEIEGNENIPKSNKFKDSGKFVTDYFDRRAQAKYAMQNPNTTLATPKPQFLSRYSDPSHPANSGSLISLITGGHINPKARKMERRAARGERRQNKRIRSAYRRSEVITPETELRRKRKQGLDVLYLIVVSFDPESPEYQAGLRSVGEEKGM